MRPAAQQTSETFANDLCRIGNRHLIDVFVQRADEDQIFKSIQMACSVCRGVLSHVETTSHRVLPA